MPKFKNGDKIIRTGSKNLSVNTGDIVTIHDIDSNGNIILEEYINDGREFSDTYFEIYIEEGSNIEPLLFN